MIQQTDLTNASTKAYAFLSSMYSDTYFPDFLVDKCKQVLLDLCAAIEVQKPANLDALYALTHSSTNHINGLEREFFANGSEIETMARECLASDFEFVATAYGFEADIEELIATREW